MPAAFTKAAPVRAPPCSMRGWIANTTCRAPDGYYAVPHRIVHGTGGLDCLVHLGSAIHEREGIIAEFSVSEFTVVVGSHYTGSNFVKSNADAQLFRQALLAPPHTIH